MSKSIPIAARRYLDKIGITGKWESSIYWPTNPKAHYFVVIEHDKDEFSVTVAKHTMSEGWFTARDKGWQPTKQTIVCWSEIKI